MKHLTVLLVFMLLLSCNNSDDENGNDQTPINNINLVTGLVIAPDEFSSGIRLGNPNTLVNQTLVYPNPPINNMTVLSAFGANMEAIWIVPGQEEMIYPEIDFSSVYDQDTYSET
ncbi:MAG: hypothetical protein HRU26_06250, partial [Psychroserpens sp.]|nr:hypothetical protein [Psychroserpens sp.]